MSIGWCDLFVLDQLTVIERSIQNVAVIFKPLLLENVVKKLLPNLTEDVF